MCIYICLQATHNPRLLFNGLVVSMPITHAVGCGFDPGWDIHVSMISGQRFQRKISKKWQKN